LFTEPTFRVNGPQADMRSVCVIRTTVGQLFNW